MTDGQAEGDPNRGTGVATDCWPELPPPPVMETRPTAPPQEWQRVGRGPKRRTRWDRPPPPKDWRFFVGWIGRTLIVLGLLMFLFVAYQLWGTGIETARAQNELEDKWEELRAELNVDATPVLTVAPAPTAPAETLPPQTLPPVTVPGSTTPSGAPVTLPPQTVPTTAAPAPTTPAAAPVNLPPPERKVPLGYIAIPKIDVGYFFVPGVSRNDLKSGPGHFPDTPIPGTLGNAAIAGHRTTYGGPFGRLDELGVGDDIEVELIDGSAFVYVVTATEVVEPSDYHVISNSDASRATLTLVTCTPKSTSTHRLIVHAEIDPSRSAPVSASAYYILDEVPTEPVLPADEPAADDPTMVPPTAAPVATPAATTPTSNATAATAPTGTTPATAPVDGSVAPGDTEPAGEPTTTTAVAVAPVEPPAPADDIDDGFVSAPVAERGDDVFSEGWFADSAAWPQIILWGLVLIAIGIGGWWLARFWKREWVGVLAALAPFVVCLYFFFQNVNRLLPAGL